jgi:hypothetical protein
MILVRTNHPCSSVRRHRWYQSIKSIIHSVRSYFREHVVLKHLYVHIRTIVVLTGGKLIGFYFLHLILIIYYSVMTHRRKGKNVSFLSPGDVNPGSVPSRRGLLEDSPYRAVGAACLSCDWSRPHT